MEMIAMLGGLSTGDGDASGTNPMSLSKNIVSPPPIKSAGVTSPDVTQPDTVKLVSVFAVGAVLGFFLGRSRR